MMLQARSSEIETSDSQFLNTARPRDRNGLSFGIINLLRGAAVLLLMWLVLTSPPAWSVTYTSQTSGNWASGATWVGGVAPGSTINAADSVIINHSVTYDLGADLDNNGVIRIETITPAPAAPGAFILPSGRSVFNRATGRWIMEYGKFQQCRFPDCTDVKGVQTNNAGQLVNDGGQMTISFSIIEIAQDWTNISSGQRRIDSSCVKTGQNFSLSGSSSTDRLIDTSISVGWHGSGNIQQSDGSLFTDRVRYQLAGTSGGFEINSGTLLAGSDMDYITVRNHIDNTQSGGGITASGSVLGTANLKGYYAGAGGYNPNGRFTGTQTATPDNTALYFPDAKCSYANNYLYKANLTVSKTNGVNSLVAGQTTNYTVTFANLGPSPADKSLIKDVTSAGLGKCMVASCATTGLAVCPPSFTGFFSPTGVEIPTLPANSTVTLQVSCAVTATGL